MKIFVYSYLAFLILSLSSCALFKRERVHENNAIARRELNLPIFLYPAKKPAKKKLLIFLSGDGGWVEFEDALSQKFADNGFYTIGINSRDYFWNQKTPEQTKNDLLHLIRRYTLLYKTDQIYLCGYSFGADVVPFIYNRLPNRIKHRVIALEMLSPFSTTSFKVHFADLTNISADNYAYKVDKEVEKVNIPIFCFYGVAEEPKPLKFIAKKNFMLDSLQGTHRYDEVDYGKIVSVINRKISN
ncbi:type IV secretory pathway VirJ component [Pedobacter sp. UYP24]